MYFAWYSSDLITEKYDLQVLFRPLYVASGASYVICVLPGSKYGVKRVVNRQSSLYWNFTSVPVNKTLVQLHSIMLHNCRYILLERKKSFVFCPDSLPRYFCTSSIVESPSPRTALSSTSHRLFGKLLFIKPHSGFCAILRAFPTLRATKCLSSLLP